MPNYKTNLWTGEVAGQHGLHLSGVFQDINTIANGENGIIQFSAAAIAAKNLHSIPQAQYARDDARAFLWGVLEQYYTAYTGGANTAVVDRNSSSAQDVDVQKNETGSGEGKTTKMTVSKSSLSLVDEDTAKTTYTVVFNYAVGTPGGDTLEVEDE